MQDDLEMLSASSSRFINPPFMQLYLTNANVPYLVHRSSRTLFSRSPELITALLGINCAVALSQSFEQIARTDLSALARYRRGFLEISRGQCVQAFTPWCELLHSSWRSRCIQHSCLMDVRSSFFPQTVFQNCPRWSVFFHFFNILWFSSAHTSFSNIFCLKLWASRDRGYDGDQRVRSW